MVIFILNCHLFDAIRLCFECVVIYIAGFLLKDVLTKEMEDYVSGYYTSPGVAGGTQYIPDTSSYSYGNPTR